jgi:hypothetical protein
MARRLLRHARKGAAALVLAVAIAIPLQVPAHAGTVAPCAKPVLFGGAAVNVFVLPYTYKDDRYDELSEAARIVAFMLKLDLLATARYGSLGVIRLEPMETPQACDPEQVLELLRTGRVSDDFGMPTPGSGIILLWGNFFESAGALYVQSYLSFLRYEGTDDIPIEVGRGEPLEARLPAQQIAFAPRMLKDGDVAWLAEHAEEVSALRQSPSDDAPAVTLELAEVESFIFGVQDADGGWLELVSYGDQPGGFVRLGADTSASLRKMLPELYLVDGLIGYLTLRARHEDHGFEFSIPERIVELIEASLANYRDSIEPRRERLPAGLSHALAGATHLLAARYNRTDSTVSRYIALKELEQAADLLPDNSNALAFNALVRMAGPDPEDVKVTEAMLSRALIAAPGDPLALTGLERLYGELIVRPDAAMTYSRGDLDKRLEAIHTMRRLQAQ